MDGGEGGGVTLTVTIPPNVVATVHIPTSTGRVDEASAPGVLVAGRKVGGALITEIGSGTWTFSELGEEVEVIVVEKRQLEKRWQCQWHIRAREGGLGTWAFVGRVLLAGTR